LIFKDIKIIVIVKKIISEILQILKFDLVDLVTYKFVHLNLLVDHIIQFFYIDKFEVNIVLNRIGKGTSNQTLHTYTHITFHIKSIILSTYDINIL